MALALRLGSFPPTSSCALRAASSSCRSESYEERSGSSERWARSDRAGFGEPALFRFHGDAIETLIALGKLEEQTR